MTGRFFYDPEIARALDDDVHAAIYLENLRLRELKPGSQVLVSPAEVRRVTGMRAAAVAQARAALVRAGFIELRGTDGRDTVHVLRREVIAATLDAWRLRAEADERAPPKPERKRAEQPALLEAGPISADDLLAGRFDGVAASDELLTALVRFWARTWRHPESVTLTKERRAALKRAIVDDKRKPSDIAKACVGMLEDPWPERAKPGMHELQHVVRQLEKWLGLYAAVQAGAPSKAGAVGTATRIVRGHVVPADYEWTEADTFNAADTRLRFDLDLKRWVKINAERSAAR